MTTMNDLERKAVLSGKGVSELKGNVNGTTDKNVQSMKDKVASLLTKRKFDENLFEKPKFELKFRPLISKKGSNVVFLHVSLEKDNGEGNIYFRANYLEPVLKMLPELEESDTVISKYKELFQGVKRAKLRASQYGPNQARTSFKGGNSYYQEILFFLVSVPDSLQEIISVIKYAFQMDTFFVALEMFIETSNYKRGPLLETMLNKDSEMRQCLNKTSKKEFPNKVEEYDALDAVLLDEDIYSVLKIMFPDEEPKKIEHIMKTGFLNYAVKMEP